MIDNSQRTAAKIAGWSDIFSFAIVVFANYVLLNPLIVPRNAADTARNLLAHPTQFRIALTYVLTYSVGAVVLPVRSSHFLANQSLSSLNRRIVSIGLCHVVAAFRSIRSARCDSWKHSYLQVFEPDRLQALARVMIASTFDAYYVGLPFFGLAATVCAWLWLKSNYIPRGLSIFGVIASAWCVLCAVVYLIFPEFNKIVNDYIFDTPMALFELVLSFWLLFKGLKPVAPVQAQTGVV